MKKMYLCIVLLVPFRALSFPPLVFQYNLLADDLRHCRTTGYKTHDSLMKLHGTDNNLQGSLQVTGNKLDLAVMGEGFFRLRKGDGSCVYTRDGRFRIDSRCRLVGHQGHLLLPEIVFPADFLLDTVSVSRDGRLSCRTAGGKVFQAVLRLHMFSAVKRSDGALLVLAPGEKVRVLVSGSGGSGQILQGLVEMSNVALTDTTVRMLVVLHEMKKGKYPGISTHDIDLRILLLRTAVSQWLVDTRLHALSRTIGQLRNDLGDIRHALEKRARDDKTPGGTNGISAALRRQIDDNTLRMELENRQTLFIEEISRVMPFPECR